MTAAAGFAEALYCNRPLDFALDWNHVRLDSAFWSDLEPRLQAAYRAMEALEGGAIANPDEDRMVGHYWLRNAALAPSSALQAQIMDTLKAIEDFAAQVHSGALKGAGGTFTDLLVIGIGGSALGPQFVAQALGQPGEDRLDVHFFDNTDPDGMDLTLAQLRGRLSTTLAVVISKSGGTPETRNGMLEAAQAFLGEGVPFASQAVAVTGAGSRLDQTAEADGWLARFPMFDWVGGRTSETAAVGLLPAALQGFDITALLKGAADMDAVTRNPVTTENPAAILAALWYHCTSGRGEKDMVILPYKDRLQLFSKYLQQLIMESLGKELDLDGKVVHQGIAVYGNKGSTDQHAYVQQLREGVPNFFATFIEVLQDREGASLEVEEGVTAGDYLHAFLQGTREALAENGRESLTLTIRKVNAASVGQLIALYERAVGLYASLVNINAYHQPGVEAGKKAAAAFLDLQKAILAKLKARAGDNNKHALSAAELAEALDGAPSVASVYRILEHLSANPDKGIEAEGTAPGERRYRARA